MSFPIGPASEQRERARRLRACRRRGRRFRYFAAFALLLAVGFVVRLAAVGLPQEWVDRMAEAASTDDYAVELDHVTFSLPTMRLRIGAARVCPRGTVGEPLVRIAGATVLLRPHLAKPDASWVSAIRIDDVVAVLPPPGEAAAETPEAAPAAPPTVLEDFPPVEFRCRSADLFGLRCRNLAATLSVGGGAFVLADARADFEEEGEPPQRVEGSFRLDPASGAMESAGRGRLDPNKLSDLLEGLGVGAVAGELGKFGFPDLAPDVDVSFRLAPADAVRELRVRLESDGGYYNQVALSSFSGVVDVGGTDGWTRVTIDPLHVVRPEGTVDARIGVDLADATVSFAGSGSLDPLRLGALIGLLSDSADLPVSFANPSEVSFSGTYGFADRSADATDLRFSLRSPALTADGIRFARFAADGTMRGRELRIERAEADAMDGALSLEFGLTLPANERERMQVSVSGDVRDTSYFEWLAAFDEPLENPNPGRLDLSLELHGPSDDVFSGRLLESTGSANLAIRNAGLLRIPFFAGLTDLLSDYVPGADLLVDQDALRVEGAFRNGRLDVGTFDLSGGAFSVTGSGRIWTDGELDMTMDVRLFNRETWLGAGMYWLSTPISKLFAIRLSGTLDDPNWGSARLSSGSSRE